jgi:SAM-dependent methyltransferase
MDEEGTSDQRHHWDRVFEGAEDYFGPEPSEFGRRALEMFRAAAVKDILELGCGQGRDTWLFAREGMKVIALDYSESGVCQMRRKACQMCLDPNVSCVVQDVRAGIPLPDSCVDAVYSHMFFTMELWEKEIRYILAECLRVLRPGGLNIYTVRNDHDPHFKKGLHWGEDMWQSPTGFVVHFFSEDKIRRMAEGYQVLHVREFDDLAKQYTRKLYEVVLRKA